MAELDKQAVLKEFGGNAFSTFKKALTQLAVERIGPIGAETKRLLAATDEIDRILADGSSRARAIAEPIVKEVKQIVGFIAS